MFLFVLHVMIPPSHILSVESDAVSSAVTPMMQQYFSIKKSHKDFLLFYRMGDFYELFFEDAVIAARDLEIVLTKRGKYLDQDVPMCGVPVHAREIYLHKLIKKGHSVAICEQVESPEDAKKRGCKSVVRREVTRIITPGTLFEDVLLEAKEHNHLCCIYEQRGKIFISCAEVSLGVWHVICIDFCNLDAEIVRLKPSEILVSEGLAKKFDLHDKFRDVRITVISENFYDFTRAQEKLCQFYHVNFVSAIGEFSECEIIVLGAMLEYLLYTQKGSMPRLSYPRQTLPSDYMAIDSSTRRNLELVRNINGGKENSLLDVLDFTKTACGGRILLHNISYPLIDPNAIAFRLDSVEVIFREQQLRDMLSEAMKKFPDLERALTRINASRASYVDLAIVRDAMVVGTYVGELLHKNTAKLSVEMLSVLKQIGGFGSLLDLLKHAVNLDQYDRSDVIDQSRHGPVRRGYSAQLDKQYELKHNSNDILDKMRDKYRRTTGVNTLKITRNNIFGYFVEVTHVNASKMTDPMFIHRQSLGSVIRYVTKELQQLESELILCDTRIKQLEDAIFADLCSKVSDGSEQLMLLAQSIGRLDVICSFATVATTYCYVRPIIDSSVYLEIVDGRHPILERCSSGVCESDVFHTNTCTMNEEENLLLITGPNMAGKSTFLRQNALICIMAQIGCFVPAKSARIGAIDKIFSRIGAGDNIVQKQSTFMVEMLETANILRDATRHSLLILDEVGRGTSTYDGLAIAWAILEWINSKIEARTMFATHYHELTQLESLLKHMVCYTMLVQEWGNKIVFMHEVIKGKSDKSYGIHVAELAGIPEAVTGRAHEILHMLSSSGVGHDIKLMCAEVEQEDSICYTNNNACCEQRIQKLPDNIATMMSIVDEVDLEHITPGKAIDAIYALKKLHQAGAR